MNARERPTIHSSERVPAAPDGLFSTEREVYRREVGRLIAAGHEGKWLLIKGEVVLELFDTEEKALDVRAERFFGEPVLVQQVLVWEPFLRYFPCHNWTTPGSPQSIHYTQLPPTAPDSLFYAEREVYRREVGRLIAAGHEGKWLLIKGEGVLELFDTEEKALDVRAERFFGEPVLVQQVLVWEPALRITPRYI